MSSPTLLSAAKRVLRELESDDVSIGAIEDLEEAVKKAEVAEPLTEADIKYFADRHHEEVMCSACKEWTSFGESCCGMTECESECPICLENE